MRYPLELFVLALIEGRYSDVEQAAPLWSPDAIQSRARRILSSAARPKFSDPRHVARALGHRLLPRAPRGLCGEGCAPGVIAYDWGTSPKVRGKLVMHGVAHQDLLTQPDESNETDAWLLTIELLMPAYDVHPLGLADLIECVWAPEGIVRAHLGSVRGCFLGGSNKSFRL